MDVPAAAVVDNAAREQFEIAMDGTTAILQYGIRDGQMLLYHTEVPPAFRGRGYGERLARAALASARERGLTAVPLCPFVRAFLERHPEAASG